MLENNLTIKSGTKVEEEEDIQRLEQSTNNRKFQEEEEYMFNVECIMKKYNGFVAFLAWSTM